MVVTTNSELPITAVRSQLVHCVRECSSCVVLGETGCGKSTQLPKFICDAGLNGDRMVAVTQPRRVAAVTLATRVAQEKKCLVGHEVGYSVRFDACCSDRTRILYCTDGILLREAVHDNLLKRFSFVILDEAHERTLHTDVLFGIVKRAQRDREMHPQLSPLKIVVMSATMDVTIFADFFSNAPVYYIEGRLHPITLNYTRLAQSDHVHSTLVTIFQIHQQEANTGTILAFLTGQDEIDTLQRRIRELSRELPPGLPRLDVLPLYAALNVHQQLRVFEPCKPNFRRIVLATNIAETSLTIPNVKFVIDSGRVKTRMFNSGKCLDLLHVVTVSKAQACQRTGRAGRSQPGICYRLYTEHDYDCMHDQTKPEIERCSLSGIVLELLSWRAGIDVYEFDFITKPQTEALDAAVLELVQLGAIVRPEVMTSSTQRRRLELTGLGLQMAKFPLDPKLSRMLIVSDRLGCLREMIAIVAIMTHENVLIHHAVDREKCAQAQAKFLDDSGDHLSFLTVFNEFQQIVGTAGHDAHAIRNWCAQNFVQERNMRTVVQIYEQLREICTKQIHLTPNVVPVVSREIVRRALCFGLCANAAELDTSRGQYRVLSRDMNARIHPSSCLAGKLPSLVVFSELVLTNQLYMRDVTVVCKEWLDEARSATADIISK